MHHVEINHVWLQHAQRADSRREKCCAGAAGSPGVFYDDHVGGDTPYGGVAAAGRKVSYYYSKVEILKDQDVIAHFGPACSFAELYNIWGEHREVVQQEILANREMVK